MSEIEELRSPPTDSLIREIAAFLASFVRDGGLANPLSGDAEEHCWERRMRWWWLLNPFCRPDTPIGVLLRDGEGKIAGFAGFIPHDYEVKGETVPGLISTTFFVSEEQRGKAMSMILRAERWARDYHMVDGSPSDKMQRILERLKYERLAQETQHIYIVKQNGITPKALLTRIGSVLSRQGSRAAFKGPARFTSRVEDIAAVPPVRHDTLRRRITREGLSWFIASGTHPKRLIAVCDAHGALMAYGVGALRGLRGLKVLRFVDYASFHPSFDLDALFSYTALHRDVFDLPADLDLLTWPSFNGDSPRRRLLSLQRPAALYYKVPSSWQYSRKEARPDEGDLPLL